MVRKSSLIKRRVDTSSGVSETIGAILLVSLVVLAVAIIAVALLSQPLPEKTPNVHFIASTNGNGTTLYLYHDSGETINTDQLSLMINEKPKYTFSVDDGSNAWSVGKNLVVNLYNQTTGGYIVPNTVKIVYDAGSSQVVLDQANLKPIVTTTMVPDIMVTPTPPCPTNCNIASCNDDEIGDAYTNVVTNSATFYIRKGKQTSSLTAGILYFQVTNTSSYITVDGNTLPLSVDDMVVITRSSDKDNFKVFGLGDKFYQLRGNQVYLQIKDAGSGTINYFGNKTVTVDNAWITGYIDLGSSFTIISTNLNKDEYTFLAINNVTPYPYYNGYNRVDITISNIRPIGVGLFNLDYDFNSNADTGMSFIGTYGSISYK